MLSKETILLLQKSYGRKRRERLFPNDKLGVGDRFILNKLIEKIEHLGDYSPIKNMEEFGYHPLKYIENIITKN
jgi:hypothetical protein